MPVYKGLISSFLKKFLPLVFLVCGHFLKASNYDFNSNCRSAYNSIINLNFDDATVKLEAEKRRHPDNLISIYLENYIDFMRLVITEDKALFNRLKTNKSQRIAALEKGDRSSPYYAYCLAEVNLQLAAARILFNEYVTAAYEINKAYRLLNRNRRAHPTFAPNLKSLGLINALTGSIPDNYRWVMTIIGYDGTIEMGINQLAIVMNTAQNREAYSFLLLEATFFLAYVNLTLYNDDEKFSRLVQFIENNRTIQQSSQTSALINYALANIYKRSKLNNDKAIRIMMHFEACEGCHSFPLRTLLLASAKLNRLDNDAGLYFERFIEEHKGQNYIKEAYLKLGWHHFLKNDTLAYLSCLEKIKSFGAADSDEDKMALSEAENRSIPNYHLLKSRLLFDGGYYRRALETLTSGEAQNLYMSTKDALEFIYRTARIYHEMDNTDMAVAFYELTIEKGAAHKYYFAANASLNLGLIYENMEKYEEAAVYFTKAQQMNNTEYRNSINQKAKAGLNRMKSDGS